MKSLIKLILKTVVATITAVITLLALCALIGILFSGADDECDGPTDNSFCVTKTL